MQLNELGAIVSAVLGRVTIAISLMLTLLLSAVPTASAAPIVNEHFARTWERTDKPVSDLVVSRTWMWGNEPFTAAGPEEYAEAPGGLREVQYFDKSRMEINHNPSVSPDSPWYVTNGLLVKELMTGQVQVGDNAFKPREPARVNVAGDPDDASGVTYQFLATLQNDAARSEGTLINHWLTPQDDTPYVTIGELGVYGITAARYVHETNHTVAAPFWEFMNAWGTVYEQGSYQQAPLFENPFYATGFPLTEAFWASVKVAGDYQSVLIQCFERRCLTYTPENDPAWRVEAGNVGQHYFRWRYGTPSSEPTVIPGLSTSTAVLHTLEIGSCPHPDEWIVNDTGIGFTCHVPGYPEATYSVTIYLDTPTTVKFIRVMVSTAPQHNSPRIGEIGAFVLGWMARIPYEGADPDYATETVWAHINESGQFGVNGVFFLLNYPNWMDQGNLPHSPWGYLRVLEIVPSGLLEPTAMQRSLE